MVDLIALEMLFFHTQAHAALSTMILVKAMLDYQLQQQHQQRLVQQRNTPSSPFMSPATPSSQSACTPPPQADQVHNSANMQYMSDMDAMEMHKYMGAHRSGMQEPMHTHVPHQHYQANLPQQRRQQAAQHSSWSSMSGGMGMPAQQQQSESNWLQSAHMSAGVTDSSGLGGEEQDLHARLRTGQNVQQAPHAMLSSSDLGEASSSSSSNRQQQQVPSDSAASQLMAEARKQLESVEEREEIGDLGDDDVSGFLRDDWNENQDCDSFP